MPPTGVHGAETNALRPDSGVGATTAWWPISKQYTRPAVVHELDEPSWVQRPCVLLELPVVIFRPMASLSSWPHVSVLVSPLGSVPVSTSLLPTSNPVSSSRGG